MKSLMLKNAVEKLALRLLVVAVVFSGCFLWLGTMVRLTDDVQAQVQPDVYRATVSGQVTTAAYILSIEPTATVGLRIAEICVTSSPATAAAAVTATVQRRGVAASSGGTQLTNEGIGTAAVSKARFEMTTNFPGIARLGGTPGTGGAVLDQFSFVVGEIGAGTADVGSANAECRRYDPMLSVGPGVINGISVNVTAAGAGGLASGSITAVVYMGQ